MTGRLMAAVMVMFVLVIVSPVSAWADKTDDEAPPPAKCGFGGCIGKASDGGGDDDGDGDTDGSSRNWGSVRQTISLKELIRRARAECRQSGVASCGMGLALGSGAPAAAPQISPQDAARQAVAYLPLQPGKPTVGPPPTLNKWKMAAVGYPLWIWAEGNLDPAPVTRSVSGISVSLDASLAKIVYDLGDGTTITCGPGTPWRKGSVPAGTPSPDCGHTYAKPSLPKGSYTITATTHWSVAWTAGGQSGTIPFTQTSSTTLPVGEVQTLVR